jgi:hypothetical protein
VLITSEGQLARDVAYVVGNPLRHEIMSPTALEVYRFGGYSGLIGKRALYDFESTAAVAAALGVSRERLGGFVAECALEPGARAAALEPDQISELNLLIRECCRRHGVPEHHLLATNKQARSARAEICFVASERLDLKLVEIAARLGMPYRTAKRVAAREWPFGV